MPGDIEFERNSLGILWGCGEPYACNFCRIWGSSSAAEDKILSSVYQHRHSTLLHGSRRHVDCFQEMW
jgi:hypothetical protein